MSPSALAGVRALDFTHYVAGPYCTRLLAEYGAEVTKVERPLVGDPTRQLPPFYRDKPHPDGSALFLHLNVSKRSIAVDLKSPDGRAIALDLARRSDVVVENFRPGVMDALGLGWNELHAANPALVMTSISNFGQWGPFWDFRSSELVSYAMGGPMKSTGHASAEPLKLAGNITQYHAGSVAAFATLTALYRAELTGAGDHIDCSIYETQMGSRDRRTIQLTAYQYTGQVAKRAETAVSLGSGLRPTADGYIMLAGYGKRLPNLLRMIGREDLLDDPRVKDPAGALDPEFVDDIESSYLAWSLGRKKAEALAEAQRHHLVGAVVNAIDDLFTDPHFVERDPWDLIEHPHTGPHRYAGRPFLLSKSERPSLRPAPSLGMHTAEVLAELGHGDASRQELAERGVI